VLECLAKVKEQRPENAQVMRLRLHQTLALSTPSSPLHRGEGKKQERPSLAPAPTHIDVPSEFPVGVLEAGATPHSSGVSTAGAREQPRKSGGVELVQGDLHMRLAALRGEPLPLETPAAKVAAKGEELFVGVDGQRMSQVAVFNGKAQVAAKGTQVEVPGGQGTRVEPGKAPEPPRPLLPAPAWSAPGPREVILALGGAPQPYALKWQPVPGAVRYRALLARDEALNDIVTETASQAELEQSLEAGPLPPGGYYARVQTVERGEIGGRNGAGAAARGRALHAGDHGPSQGGQCSTRG
jgi:hypothetical protein